MIKIFIVDDHAVVREGLKQILSQSPDMAVVGEASNGQEAIDKISRNNFSLIILDIAMPGKSGLEVLREIKSQRPELPVLILSTYPEEQYAVRVLKAGASGYLSKESAPDELVKAIRQVSQGKKYINPTLGARLALDRDR